MGDTSEILAALRRAQHEADQLYELAAERDRPLAMAIAHRLSSSIEGMRLAIEASAVG
jgi:hypothetical protein